MSRNRLELYMHLVWTTWDRTPVIDEATEQWLWPAIAAKARALGSDRVVVGGVDDHVHIITELPPTVAVATLVKHLKGASSRLASARLGPDSLRWQHGYGAFTVPKAALPDVEAYVRNQRLAHNAVDPSARPDLEP